MADSAIDNYKETLSYLVAISLSYYIYKVCVKEPNHVSSMESPFAKIPKIGDFFKPKKITEQDKKYISAHEAGHALIYASLDFLPENFHIIIKQQQDNTHSLGYVTGIEDNNLIMDKNFSEWRMLVLLAGKKGELVHLNKESLGGADDMNKWMFIAKIYLQNHNNGVFYCNPSTKLELDSNISALNELKSQLNLILDDFFSLNKDVHEELTFYLLDNNKINKDEIIPFLNRVVFPEKFPKISNLYNH